MRKELIFQVFVASLFMLTALFISDKFSQGILAFPLGSSAFIAFCLPHSQSAHTRRLAGGYAAAAVIGVLSALVFGLTPDYNLLICVAAFALTMFFMILLRVEHPPAAAVSMAIAVSTAPINFAAAVMFDICLLCVTRKILLNKLVNLTD